MVGYTLRQLVASQIHKGRVTERHSVRSCLEFLSRLDSALLLLAAHLMGILHVHLDRFLVALEGDHASVGLNALAEGHTNDGVARKVGSVVVGMDKQNVRLGNIYI